MRNKISFVMKPIYGRICLKDCADIKFSKPLVNRLSKKGASDLAVYLLFIHYCVYVYLLFPSGVSTALNVQRDCF